MEYFPAICLDDFYSNPDEVRNFALKQDFYISKNGAWPGERTDKIHNIDLDFYNNFCKKLFSVFYDFGKSTVRWKVDTSFQKISAFSSDKNSIKNKGWIHWDKDQLFAGIIFLEPDADLNSGTSLFNLINPESLDNTDVKNKFYKSGLDDAYDNQLSTHNNSFVETIRFNNLYNRAIMFDGTVPHGVNSFWTGKEFRLTQVFFVSEVESDTKTPVERHREYL
jgi:hypothetical protein